MRARGINYDTGFLPGAELSRKSFIPEMVQHDMAVISGDLHCDAVRISGREPERLSIAARHAADAGLEVWFAPFPVDLPLDQLIPFFADCARRAEAVREAGADVVFVAGCEISAFCGGFIPGDTYGDRLRVMAAADMEWWSSLGPVQERLNEFLAQVAASVRTHFGGGSRTPPLLGSSSTGVRSTSSASMPTGLPTTPTASGTSCARTSPTASPSR